MNVQKPVFCTKLLNLDECELSFYLAHEFRFNLWLKNRYVILLNNSNKSKYLNMPNYYQPSGRFSALAIVYFVLLSLLIFPLLGLVYSYSIWYIGIIYIRVLFSVGFALSIVYILEKIVIDKGKVRSPKLVTYIGFLGALIAYYFSWVVWVDLVLQAGETINKGVYARFTISNINIGETLALAINPTALFDLIQKINEFGTWGFKNSPINGGFLYLIWTIEFVIVVGLTTIKISGKVNTPFDEMENNWFEEEELSPFMYIEEQKKLRADLEASKEEAFENLIALKNNDLNHSSFILYSSKEGQSFLTVKNIVAVLDEKEGVSYKHYDVITTIAISKSLKEKLLSRRFVYKLA